MIMKFCFCAVVVEPDEYSSSIVPSYPANDAVMLATVSDSVDCATENPPSPTVTPPWATFIPP